MDRSQEPICSYCPNKSFYFCDYFNVFTGRCPTRLCYLCKFVLDYGQTFCKDHLPESVSLGTIETANMYHDQADGKIYIYIGRRNYKFDMEASPLANPFTVKDWGEQALSKYKEILWTSIKKRDTAYQELLKLRDFYLRGLNVALLCYCAPKQCHGDIIIKAVKYLADQALNTKSSPITSERKA